MVNNELRALQDRTERLEGQVRGFQTLCGLGVLGAVVLGCVALAAPQTQPAADGILRARGVVITDDEGRDRILLGRKGSAPALTILGEDGTARVVVGFMPNPQINGKVVPRISQAWGIQVNDDTGNERGGFSYLANGRMVLGLDFAEAGEAITAAVIDGQYAAIMINDENGARERAGIYVGKDGPAVIKLGGPGGTRVMLKVSGDDPAELLLVDPSDWSTVDVMPVAKP